MPHSHSDSASNREIPPSEEKSGNAAHQHLHDEWIRAHKSESNNQFLQVDRNGYHRIRFGETPESIARKALLLISKEHATNNEIEKEVRQIIKLNPQHDFSQPLQPGMELKIPNEDLSKRVLVQDDTQQKPGDTQSTNT